jgi:trk system potassium uptake protein TrkA
VEVNNIVVVGGGLVGQTLAEKLSGDGHDVTLVECDPALASRLLDTLDVQVVEGNGATSPVLRAAGIERADLVVASTDSDECNVVVGFLAAQLFKVPRVVVRVRDPGHEEGFSLIGRDHPAEHVIINPDSAAVDRISQLLQVPGAVDVATFMDGELLVAGFSISATSDFAGLRVVDMRLLFAATPTLVVAIQRDQDWLVPHGEEEIRAGDLVYFAVPRSLLSDVLGLVGVEEDRGNRVLIAGATSIGLALARRLQSQEWRVVVVEEDLERAQRAADTLNKVLVIHGRVTDQSQLEDEEIEGVAAFISVTDDHETNLVAGLLAKRLGAGRALVLVDNPGLVAMLGEIGIDAIISQRVLTIGLALQHIRGASVRSGAALLGDEVEIIEAEAVAGCRLTSGPLMDVKLPMGVLVAARRRGEELQVPQGKDCIEPGDTVLMIATSKLSSKLSMFLQP